MLFREDFVPPTPYPALAMPQPTSSPTTTSAAEAHTSHAQSRKKATVPMVNATSMIVTAVHAAGECP